MIINPNRRSNIISNSSSILAPETPLIQTTTNVVHFNHPSQIPFPHSTNVAVLLAAPAKVGFNSNLRNSQTYR